MKKLLFVLVLVVLVLAVVVTVATLTSSSKQIRAEPAALETVDTPKVAEQLAGAIRFPTVSYEDRQRIDGAAFLALHEYLKTTFPAVHARLQREVIGGYSLLYTWTGTDPELEPAALMAHLDVVPVEEETQVNWKHPAFSGAIEESHVWGRGALDDKASVIAILHTVESLIEEGYQPRRTFFLAFGHDEEVGGNEGARRIAERLTSANVRLDLVLDEGGAVIEGSVMGLARPVAAIGVAEKGYANLELTVDVQGGHSSVPSKETAIGILSQAIARLERHPFPSALRPPVRDMLETVGPELPLFGRVVAANLWLFGGLMELYLARDPLGNALIRTTTAPTIVEAGVKANVLPSRARAVVNFRILPGDSVESVVEHVRRAIGDDRVQSRVLDAAREPSPISSMGSASWTRLQKTIRELHPDAVVIPVLLVGGSDAKHFAPLSEGVYRFAGLRATTDFLQRAHGTNERLSLENLEQLVQFMSRLIRNWNKD